jgi:hemolysin III
MEGTTTENGASPRYTVREEVANGVIHGVGTLLAIAGLVALDIFASQRGTAWHIVGCSIFGGCLILLYAASTLYHSVPYPRAKAVLRFFDHNAIFLLIAGTYTPLTLVNLRGPWGWSLFGAVWGLAILGITLRALLGSRPRALFVGLYILMGWLAVVAIKPLVDHLPTGGLVLLFGGGLAYTGGVGFYLWRRLPYHHAIWHGFVLAGSALHFFAILFYVIPWSAPAGGVG